MRLIARFKRHVIQLLAALLYNLNFEGFATGTLYKGVTKGVCVPGLNCYSCPGAIGSCPIGSLQAALVASDQKLPLYLIGTILAFGAILGRTVCGWLCPFGFLQDLLDKIPFPKLQKGMWSRVLSWGKYLVLAVLVIAAPLFLYHATGIGTPAFCAYLCPAGTLQAGIPLVAMDESLQMMVGSLFDWKIGLLIVILIACMFIYRPFCRFICPLGALYSFFNRFALLRYKVDKDQCTGCNACLSVCKVDIRTVSDRECIQCGACVTSCQTKAIRFSLRDMLQKNQQLDTVGSSPENDQTPHA